VTELSWEKVFKSRNQESGKNAIKNPEARGKGKEKKTRGGRTNGRSMLKKTAERGRIKKAPN